MRTTIVMTGQELNNHDELKRNKFDKNKYYLVKIEYVDVREITNQLIEEIFKK